MKSQFMPAARRFKKAGSMIRTNKPIVGVDYQMSPHDFGVAVNMAGVHVTLPPIVPQMQGEIYTVKNISSGDITTGPSGSDQITTAQGLATLATIHADDSLDFDVETQTNTWLIR